MDGSDDEALVARAREGDREAFRQLVERHSRNVFRLAYRLMGNEEDAEDVVQESFLKAYRSLSRFEGKSMFGSWLFRITTNCALDALRRKKPLESKSLPLPDPDSARELVSHSPSPERDVTGKQMARRVSGAMERLSQSERTAFVLRHLEGRPIAEIAQTLGIRAGATKNTIFRAVAKLRAELGALSNPHALGTDRP
ncbi:MAG: sigma-70 family RNA polymerase sigma factor [Thermoanaerobaculia bacterium]